MLLIGGACASLCLLLAYVYCYYKCFQVHKFTSFKLRCHFINLVVSNQWKQFAMEDRRRSIEKDRGWLHQIRGRMLTYEAKVVCFLKIWWRFNEALLNYLEAITIRMKPTLMKIRRFDVIHVDQGWNVCSPHG